MAALKHALSVTKDGAVIETRVFKAGTKLRADLTLDDGVVIPTGTILPTDTVRKRTVHDIDGNHGDGVGGLYLRVAGGSRRWAFRYKHRGADNWVPLGGFDDFTITEARQAARDCRRKRFFGVDLAGERRAARAAAAGARTFSEVADEYLAAHKAGWKNAKSEQQWTNTLRDYAATLKPMRVTEIGVDDVLKVLKPIWESKTETASRLRGRIEAVIDYATARGWRSGENPAKWKGRLDALLPKPGQVAKVKHHAAAPWKDVPDLMKRLEESKGASARCLAFLILTATRSGEARGAAWSEIDLAERQWVIPPERMKSKREHRVPLNDAAQKILNELLPTRRNTTDLIFPGGRAGAQLSDVAVSKALVAAGSAAFTVHGFRSTFRDWCGDTGAPREVAEMALAHAVSGVEGAYARSDLFERRRKLMTAWGAYCTGGAA